MSQRMRDGMLLALGYLRAEDERAGLVQREQRPSATLLDIAVVLARRPSCRIFFRSTFLDVAGQRMVRCRLY